MNKRFFNQQNLTRRLRLLSVLYAILLLPLGAWAENYPITVAGIQVTNANASNVLGNDFKSVSYDPTSSTLTLKGANFIDVISVGEGIEELKVHLVGYNWIGTSDCVFDKAATTKLTFTTSTTFPGSLHLNSALPADNIFYENGLSYNVDDKVIEKNLDNTTVTPFTGYVGYVDSEGSNAFIYSGNPDFFASYATAPIARSVLVSPKGTNTYLSMWSTSFSHISLINKIMVQFDWGTCTNTDVTVQVRGMEYDEQEMEYSFDGKTYSSVISLSDADDDGIVVIPLTGEITSDNFELYFSSDEGFSFYPLNFAFTLSSTYNLLIGNTQVTSDNASDVLGDGKVSFTESVGVDTAPTYTLTLDGATINGKVRSYLSNLTIELIGNNTIAVADTSAIATWFDGASLTFTTSETTPGSLTLTPGSGFYAIGDTGKNFNISYQNGLSLNPASPETGETAVVGISYGLTVGGVPVTNVNADNILAGDAQNDGKVSYADGVLTLNGAVIDDCVSTSLSSLTVNVTKDNSLSFFASESEEPSATLSFTGNGTLTLNHSDGVITNFLSVDTGGFNLLSNSTPGIHWNATSKMYMTFDDIDIATELTLTKATVYQLWVGGVQVTEANMNAITGKTIGEFKSITGSVKFSPTGNILTLTNANIGSPYNNWDSPIISNLPNLKVNINGSNILAGYTNEFIYDGGGGCLSINPDAQLVFSSDNHSSSTMQIDCYDPIASGFKSISTDNQIIYKRTSNYYWVQRIAQPTMSLVDGKLQLSDNNEIDLEYDANSAVGLKYKITNASGVTGEEKTYVATTDETISNPCTIEAWAEYQDQESDHVKGKYFGAAENPFKLVYGGEAKALTLSPAIETGDGIKISSVATGTNATYSSDTQKFTPVSTGTSNRTVTLAYTGEGGEYEEGNTVILNETFNLQVDVVPVAPTITPNGGSLAYNETITLSLPEGCDAAIEYKWGDGSVQEYTAPIAVETGTLTAWAVRTEDPNNLYSDEVTATFKKLLNPNLSFTYTWQRLEYGNTFSQEVKSDMETTPTVTWSSSDEDVATVDPTTGVVTPVAPSNSDIEITATFAGDDTYAPATASYAVSVVKGTQYLFIQYKGESTTLAKARVTKGKTLNIKENYNLICPEELVASLTWTPDNATIATVADGVVSGVNCGNTRIVVASAGNDNYEEDTYEFYIDVAPPAPTIELETGTYLSTHAPITITKENIDGTSISYTWDDITGDNNAEWTAYTDAGVTLQTGTLSAMVGYYDAENYNTIYSDTASVAYTVIPDIAECSVSGNDNVTYNGADQTPTITVTPAGGGTALTLGTDYTVSYKKGETAVESMVDAGDYTIVITAKEGSAYGGTKEEGFTISAANIADAEVSVSGTYTYTGAAIQPTTDNITVTFNDNPLTAGTDYEIQGYLNNTDAATDDSADAPTVTITGQGNFTGTATGKFTIAQADLSDAEIADIDDQDYTGEAVTPEPQVSVVLIAGNDPTVLVKGQDFNYNYENNVAVSSETNTPKVIVTGTGNYKGSAQKTFNIVASYDIWVAGTLVTSNNANNVLGGTEATVSYDEETNTLTLNGATIEPEGEGYGIEYTGTDDLVISLNGTNNVVKGGGNCNAILYNGPGVTDPTLTFSNGGTAPCSLQLEAVGVDLTTIAGFASVVNTGLYRIDDTESLTKKTTITSLGGGSGVFGDPIIIKTADDLKNFSKLVNNGTINTAAMYFRLAPEGGILDCSGLSESEYKPIGSGSQPFKGTFSGNGCTISNLIAYEGGLFGNISGATIEDLNLSNCTIAGNDYCIAGLATDASNGSTINLCTITNSTIECLSNQYDPTVGGIVARLSGNETTISNCVVNKTLIKAETTNGTSGIAGGIVGEATSGKIENCHIKGESKITDYNNAGATLYAGAIVGKYDGEYTTLSGNDYYYDVTVETRKGTDAAVKEGYTQRALGNGDDVSADNGAVMYTQKVTFPTVTGATITKDGDYYSYDDTGINVAPGQTATMIVEPSEGNAISSFTATNVEDADISSEALTENRTRYSFEMPDDAVTVTLIMKKNPELAYKQGETAVTTAEWILGKDDNTALPVLQNPHNLAPVTYASDNTDVATVATDGTVTVVGIGTAVITATTAETDEYAVGKASYTLTVKRQLDVSFSNTNSWATYCGTENLATPEGLKAYQVTAVDGSTVTIEEIGYIPVNTAVLLQNTDASNPTRSNIAASAYEGETTTFDGNILIGAAEAKSVSSITGGTVYVLYNNKFKRATSGTIPANRGYLVVEPSDVNASELSISIGDDTTGIGMVGCDSVATDNDEWYTLDGRKLQQKPTKDGLYIKNGKKVVINKK